MTNSLHKGPFTWWQAVGALLGIVGLIVLFVCNPSEAGFYPQCSLKEVTGLSCPGCGVLRATHQLLHGHVRTAFFLNPLFIIVLPVVIVILIESVRSPARRQRYVDIGCSATFTWTMVSISVLFTVLRNIPGIWWLGR